MGFFDWVSSVVETVSDVASSVWETTKEFTSSAWETTKEVAGKVIDTAVEFGGKVVDSVKNVYQKIKPYIKPIKKVVNYVGNTLGSVFPWVKTAADFIEKGLEYLEKLEDAPLMKKVSESIEWALKYLDKLKETLLGKSEEREAIERQKALRKALNQMKTEEQKRSIRFAMLINEYILVKTRIENTLEEFEHTNSTNFEHYLRLRATQKLLKVAEKKLQRATDLSQISQNDLFLIQIGNEFLAEVPEISTEDLQRLDKLVQSRFNGKKLLPFVFEELLLSWGIKLEDEQKKWNRMCSDHAEKQRRCKELKIKQEIESLSGDELEEMKTLTTEIRDIHGEIKEQESKIRAMENYIYASEGFLQVLEKTEEEWIENDREFILDECPEIGMLLIQCMQYGKEWVDLDSEQQSLIKDYANMFKKDSQTRTKKMKEELEQDIVQVEVA